MRSGNQSLDQNLKYWKIDAKMLNMRATTLNFHTEYSLAPIDISTKIGKVWSTVNTYTKLNLVLSKKA